MSHYTTGEIARLCGVSVRTVQYYDSRDLLNPSALSEGGRRMYTQEDVSKLKTICFLRSLDLPISTICQIFQEEHPENVISLLLSRQEQVLSDQISELTEKRANLAGLQKSLKFCAPFSVESIGDIASQMENKKKLRKIHMNLLLFGIPLDLVELALILLWIFKGVWLPFVLYLPVQIVGGILLSRYYFKNVAYLCPQCHSIFKPALKEAFFANHTPTTRKLTCTKCGHKGFCIETCE